MREILFRGKCIATNEWVYGYLDVYNNIYSIVNDDDEYEVKPETIGQYTGLDDRNGKKIFEGDIICESIYKTGKRNVPDNYYEIRFSQGRFCAYKGSECMNSMLVYNLFAEVVGNIYDKEVEK